MVRAQRVMRSHNDAHAAIHARKFLNRRYILDVAHPRAAKLFREDDPHQTHLAHLLYNVMRELALLVPLHDMR